MLLAGGAFYSLGGVLYALRPTALHHHDISHAFTVLAAMCHYIAMCFAVF
ncbi:hemolysin III family protein [Mycobacterium sp. 050128]